MIERLFPMYPTERQDCAASCLDPRRARNPVNAVRDHADRGTQTIGSDFPGLAVARRMKGGRVTEHVILKP